MAGFNYDRNSISNPAYSFRIFFLSGFIFAMFCFSTTTTHREKRLATLRQSKTCYPTRIKVRRMAVIFNFEHVKLGINLEYYYYCSLTLAFLQFPETVELFCCYNETSVLNNLRILNKK